jgi:hypothetical protein
MRSPPVWEVESSMRMPLMRTFWLSSAEARAASPRARSTISSGEMVAKCALMAGSVVVEPYGASV